MSHRVTETASDGALGVGQNEEHHPATDLGLLALALIWGLNFSVVKVAFEELHPLAFNALRFPMAALFLFILLRRQGPRPPVRREDVPLIFGLGVLGNIGYQLLFIFGLDWTYAGNAAILLATTPVWTTILSTILGHDRPSPGLWFGIAATVAGMVLVVVGGPDRLSLGGETLTGDLMMIAAAMVWSVYTVGGKRLTRAYGALRVTAWTLWIGTGGLILMGAPYLARTPLTSLEPGTWGAVAYAGIFALGIAYTLWYQGVRRIGSSRTAVYSNLVPVVALVAAWLWLGERPTPLQLAGAAAVIGGLSVARLSRGEEPPSPPPVE